MRLRRISVAIVVAILAGLLLYVSTTVAQSDAKPAKLTDGFVIGKFLLIERKDGGIVVLEQPEVRTLAGKPFLVGKTARLAFNDPRFSDSILWVWLDDVRQFGEAADLSIIERAIFDGMHRKRALAEDEAKANATKKAEQRNETKSR